MTTRAQKMISFFGNRSEFYEEYKQLIGKEPTEESMAGYHTGRLVRKGLSTGEVCRVTPFTKTQLGEAPDDFYFAYFRGLGAFEGNTLNEKASNLVAAILLPRLLSC